MDQTLIILAAGGAIIAVVIALQFRPKRSPKANEREFVNDGSHNANQLDPGGNGPTGD